MPPREPNTPTKKWKKMIHPIGRGSFHNTTTNVWDIRRLMASCCAMLCFCDVCLLRGPSVKRTVCMRLQDMDLFEHQGQHGLKDCQSDFTPLFCMLNATELLGKCLCCAWLQWIWWPYCHLGSRQWAHQGCTSHNVDSLNARISFLKLSNPTQFNPQVQHFQP